MRQCQVHWGMVYNGQVVVMQRQDFGLGRRAREMVPNQVTLLKPGGGLGDREEKPDVCHHHHRF